MRKWIARHYGTERGWVRLMLAQVESAIGGLPECRRIDWTKVERFVFVCHGNICRSAYADVLARKRGLPSASFGLAGATGNPADAVAQEVAAKRGTSLADHRATSVGSFTFAEGDLLLAMEPRQIRRMRKDDRLNDRQRTLLGLWTDPVTPHLHDPFTLSPEYFDTCFARIETGIDTLEQLYRDSR